MTHRCGICRTMRGRERLMPDGRRHLHELEPRQGFRFPLTGKVSRLVAASAGRAVIETPDSPEDVEFTTHEGKDVSFTRPANGAEPCSPTAQVIPMEGR